MFIYKYRYPSKHIIIYCVEKQVIVATDNKSIKLT